MGTADGVFGQGTYHAVIAFQKVQGLTRDGVVGSATWARLAKPYVPAPRYRMATASLEVNLARQVIYYVRGGTIQRIIDASTGSGAWYYSQGRWARAITPTGRFRIYWRYNGWQAGPLGSMYRPNYFYAGYAVLGMTSVPAYPASHGCVRMTGPDVVLAVDRHAGRDLQLVIAADLFRMLARPGMPRRASYSPHGRVTASRWAKS